MTLARIACSALLASGVAFTHGALAQGAGLRSHNEAAVPYMTGGVGTDEQARMKALEQEGYNLTLLFAEKGTGAYLADVHVRVMDTAGRTMLDAMADGPALVAKLPPGRYQIVAEHGGIRQTRTVNAGRGGQVAFYWTSEPASAPQPASARAPHGDAPPLAPAHAGQGVGSGR